MNGADVPVGKFSNPVDQSGYLPIKLIHTLDANTTATTVTP